MPRNALLDGLDRLSGGDKNLLRGFIFMSLLTLALGLVYGTATAFARAGFIEFEPETGYRMLSLHGVTIFFYWLYFVQAGFVLALAAVYGGGAQRIGWRPLAWLGFGLMSTGFVLSELTPFFGAILLYDAQPNLAGENTTEAGLFYLGYILLSVGLFLVAMSSIATALVAKLDGTIESWSSVGFATVAWAGLLMVSSVAAINAFLPAMLWVFGLGPAIPDYTMSWHVLFHNMHYLPLMATVVIWYVLMEVLAGVKSIFGQRFSKIVFALYLVFVPPTSLYHMFLEPGLADVVKVVGSLLSLFISVPTVLVFLIIVASLETHARANGGRGLFGWIRMLPWQNPAMAATGMAVVNLALGGAFSFVLIQERLAVLLSDTFFVPGYFHFLTLGTVSLTFLALLTYVIPGITGNPLWRPRVLTALPYVMTFGLLIFGAAGIAAGYMGVPRRVLSVGYEGATPEIWQMMMMFVGIGATFMAATLAVYVYGLACTLLAPAREAVAGIAGMVTVAWQGVPIDRRSAWVGPICVAILVGTMVVFTSLAFEILKDMPIVVQGGGGH